MFQPLRFNHLLKAVPGLAHLQLTPHAAHHAAVHAQEHTKEQVELTRGDGRDYEIRATRIKEDLRKDVKIDTKQGLKTTKVHEHISEEINFKRVEPLGDDERGTLERVHATVCGVAEIEMTPPHLPREETPIYARTHHRLVYVEDTPCAICGVRHSTLNNPRENSFKAQAIETHHYPIERSLLNACDPKKVRVIFPQVKDRATLEAFIDSEENMMVLCDIHHRHPHYGIHHILAQDFFVQPFLFGGYQVVAEAEEAEKVMVSNERILKAHIAVSSRGS